LERAASRTGQEQKQLLSSSECQAEAVVLKLVKGGVQGQADRSQKLMTKEPGREELLDAGHGALSEKSIEPYVSSRSPNRKGF
jgi:hypothetical protein